MIWLVSKSLEAGRNSLEAFASETKYVLKKSLPLDIEVQPTPTADCDHIFVSYAVEDFVFARWLTLRLTNEGYKVWCDQIKLLGGESYPLDIRKAIAESTFRLLAVISKFSIDKPNPLKERTLAINVGRKRQIPDFVIPLNLDGSKAADLDLLTTDITYIPFYHGWADGLSKVLLKLEKVNSPKGILAGKQAVVSWINSQQKFIAKKDERVWTNIIPVVQCPKEIYSYYVANMPKDGMVDWPTYQKSERSVWAFGSPNRTSAVYAEKSEVFTNWATKLSAGDVDTFHIASGILRRAIENYCISRGMRVTEQQKRKSIYFPFNMFPRNRIPYRRFDGKVTSVNVIGRKTIRRSTGEKELSWYHLAPYFVTIMNRFGDPYYQVNLRLVWTDGQGNEQKVPTGRRRLKWYNYEWLARIAAINQWIANGEDTQNIFVGEGVNISIAGNPLTLTSPYHIDEDFLSDNAEEDDEDEEIEEEGTEKENDEEPQVEFKNSLKPD